MFTGIVERTGRVVSVERGAGATFSVDAGELCSSLKNGDSVSINGVCQTVSAIRGTAFSFFSTEATLSLTNLKRLSAGTVVNLERAMAANGRFDGHFVTGHADGETSVSIVDVRTDARHVSFSLPAGWGKYVVHKGAIAVNGVSLTVYECSANSFTVVLIPYTVSHTNLLSLAPGDMVNIELDMLAKYVERLLEHGNTGRDSDARLRDMLEGA